MRKIFDLRGFTLVELLVTIGIIATLITTLIVVSNPNSQLQKTNDAKRKAELTQLQKALDAYYSDYNRYPAAVNGQISGALWGGSWGQYMAKIPKDPRFSGRYLYQAASDGSWYRIFAKLEHCPDANTIPGVNCARAQYNYTVVSPNLSVLAYGRVEPSQAPPPTFTPVPTFSPPTSTPIPTPTSTPSPTPTPTPLPYRRVFVSSQIYNGNLGGLSGADAKCQTLADNAHLGGTYKAWLSDSSTDARGRLTHSTLPYKLVDGNTTVANDWNDLIRGSLRNQISTNENGGVIYPYEWTNTTSDGYKVEDFTSGTCLNLTSSSSSYYTVVGFNINKNSQWSSYKNDNCNFNRALYCFEQ